MRYVVVIPARYESSRLPGKPLVSIAGIPMIVRTYRRCILAVDPSLVYVATDDERIASVCRAEGINVVMTSSHCLTGTDRVAEFARIVDADVYINVQGDEPLFDPDDLALLVTNLDKYPGEIINGYCETASEQQYFSPMIPKVVFRPDGRLMYMSRAPIPTDKQHAYHRAFRQVCAYAFPKSALEHFSAVKEKTLLESIEDIEILRFLELGLEVRMVPMGSASIAVDTPADIVAVEEAIKQRGLH